MITAETARYTHRGLITHTRVTSTEGGTIHLSLGNDGPAGWQTVTAQISADDARHLAGQLEQAAEDVDR